MAIIRKRSGRPRRWMVRPPYPRHLDAARGLLGQALRILEAIPPEMALTLADELYFSKLDIERTLNVPLRYVANGPRTSIGILGIRPPAPRREDRQKRSAQLLQEASHQRKPQITPPGPSKAGYVKEIVVKYKLRPVPYSARLVGKTIWTSRHVFEIFRGLRCELREHVMVVHVNGANRVISVDHAATGGEKECLCSASVVFRNAMLAGAAAVILVHNHPTGQPTPTGSDLALMDEIKRIGDLVRIPLVDFIIIGDEAHWSASDHGLLLRGPGMPGASDSGSGTERTGPAKGKIEGHAARKGKLRSRVSGA
jgi:DNA repair protein RadC